MGLGALIAALRRLIWVDARKDGVFWFNALNRNTYILLEIIRPFAVILVILVLLFAGYSLTGILSDAVTGLLPVGSVVALTCLKVVIALEVLIPISLFIGVVTGFGRMQADSEITAMLALGIGPKQFLTPVISLAVALALVVSSLSLFARPWAYSSLHAISRQAAAALNVNAMEAGTFYANRNGDQVIFLGRRAGPQAPAHDIFVARYHDSQAEVMFAGSATPALTGSDGKRSVQLEDVHVYQFNTDAPAQNKSLQAVNFTVRLNDTTISSPAYSALAASTAHLLQASTPANIAERQWRFSTGLSTLLLAILGAILSRSRPRQSRYARFGPAVLAYTLYYLLFTSARTWVQHGNIGVFPGLWWVPTLLGLAIIVIWFAPRWSRKLQQLCQSPSPALLSNTHNKNA